MTTPEAQIPALDFSNFDFNAYNEQVASIEDQARKELVGILTVQSDEGVERSFEQIKAEAEEFFANPIVIEFERVMDMAAAHFAAFCMAHGEGGDVMREGSLGSIYEKGTELLHDMHNHDDHSDGDSDKDKKGKNSKMAKHEAAARTPASESRGNWRYIFRHGFLAWLLEKSGKAGGAAK